MKKRILLLCCLAGLVLGSCQEWLDVDGNVDSPDWVEPALRLGPVIGAYEGIAYDMRVIGKFCQFFAGAGLSSNWNLHGYQSGSDSGGEAFRMVYWLQGENLEFIINDGRSLGQYTMAGIGLTIKAYSWHLLTCANGDVPLEDAFVPGLLAHRYNSQEEVFAAVRKWAKEAIVELEKQDNTNYGAKLSTYDLIYQGDREKWKKLAYAVLARNYIAMSKKGTQYLDSAIIYADKSFASPADDAAYSMGATKSQDSNFYGTLRGNITGSNLYVQTDWAVLMETGNLRTYDPSGVIVDTGDPAIQIICDTLTFDPRRVLLFGTASAKSDDPTQYVYGFTPPQTAGLSSGTNFFGLTVAATPANSGTGRWLYRDEAPYPLTTYAEIQFVKAEAAYLKGDKATAFEAFKKGVSGHMEFCKRYIVANDKITPAQFTAYAEEYMNSRFVRGLDMATFSLSHIMMQKWLSLYPWSQEAWVDLRRYNYDLVLGASGVPEAGVSYTETVVYHKAENDPSRIYKGFYLPPADIQNRRAKFVNDNLGAPCNRLRPRYNSEYMWNRPSLDKLTPIPGTANNYQTSLMWFSYPAN